MEAGSEALPLEVTSTVLPIKHLGSKGIVALDPKSGDITTMLSEHDHDLLDRMNSSGVYFDLKTLVRRLGRRI